MGGFGGHLGFCSKTERFESGPWGDLRNGNPSGHGLHNWDYVQHLLDGVSPSKS